MLLKLIYKYFVRDFVAKRVRKVQLKKKNGIQINV